MRKLTIGDRLPNFGLSDQTGRRIEIYTAISGGPIVIAFLPRRGDGSRKRVLAEMATAIPLLREHKAHVFAVVSGDAKEVRAINESVDAPFPILTDNKNEIVKPYLQAFDLTGPGVMVLDPNQRVTALANCNENFTEVVTKALDNQATIELPRLISAVAPVLAIPNLLDAEYCHRLIQIWHDGDKEEGRIVKMKDSEGILQVDDDFKRRLDHIITDPELEEELGITLLPRLEPEVDRVYRYSEWVFEKFRVGRYSADSAGFFSAHRDNANPHVRRRRYAVTINLNANDYAGGDLRFPEYGSDLYRPPTGGAIVFSCGLLHEVVPVTRGARYVLLTFLLDPPSGA